MAMAYYRFDEEFPEDDSVWIDWPFKEMLVGQTVKLTDPKMVKKGQVYAHSFGHRKNRKFKTKRVGDFLFVKRTV
jgi:hypothetical protein